MARIRDGGEVSPEAIRARPVAVIGYGNQGRPQALNLRDAGAHVLIGNRPEDAYAARARADGFAVLPIREAAQQADIVLFLLPDEVQPEIYASDLEPVLHGGQTLCFASGYNFSLWVADSGDTTAALPRGGGASSKRACAISRGAGSGCSPSRSSSMRNGSSGSSAGSPAGRRSSQSKGGVV